MSTPGYNPLTKAFDEAKTFRIIIDDPLAGGIAGLTFAFQSFANAVTKTPELNKTSGISVVDPSGVVEVVFTTTETADFALGVHRYRLVVVGSNVPISYGPFVIVNVAPGGAGGIVDPASSLVPWRRITDTPTTLAGYGITDGSTGTGSVTSVSITPANGISGTVLFPTTAPEISLSLDAITPTSVNGVVFSGSASPTLTVTGISSIQGVNTGDQTNISGNAATVSVIDAGADTTVWSLFANTQTGPQSPATINGCTANAATGVLTVPGLVIGTTTIVSAGTWTLTLPTTDGSPSQFLQTNGSGVTTWADAGGGGVFTSVDSLSDDPRAVTDWGPILNTAIAAGTRHFIFGPFNYPYSTTLSCLHDGIFFEGAAGYNWYPPLTGTGYTRLLWEGVGNTIAMTLNSNNDNLSYYGFVATDIAWIYTSDSYTGTMIDARRAVKASFIRCHFSYRLSTVEMITAATRCFDLGRAIAIVFESCGWQGFHTYILGFSGTGVETWANTARFQDCLFQGICDYSVVNPGNSWVFDGCIFESSTGDIGVDAHIKISAECIFETVVTLRDCTHWDADDVGMKWIEQDSGIAAYILLENCEEHTSGLTKSLDFQGKGTITIIGGLYGAVIDWGDGSNVNHRKAAISAHGATWGPANLNRDSGHTVVNFAGNYDSQGNNAGEPMAPTQALGNNSTLIATTAYVVANGAGNVVDESGDATCFPCFFTSATGIQGAKTTASNWTFNAAIGQTRIGKALVGSFALDPSMLLLGNANLDQTTVSTNYAVIQTGAGATLLNASAGQALTLNVGNNVAWTINDSRQLLSNNVSNINRVITVVISSNDHEFYGFGVNTNAMRYQVGATTSDHVWYAATSSTTSVELMRMSGTGILSVGFNATLLGVLKLYGNMSGYVQIQPAAAAGSWTLTLPTNDGNADQFLRTDGNGVTSWVTHGFFQASPSTDLAVSGETAMLTAGELLAFGDPVYIKSDGKMWKADANGSSTYPADAMAAATIAGDEAGIFLMRGWARNDAWAWTVGGLLYLSTTGTITQTAPSGTGEVIQVLGKASHADRIYFAPERTYSVHA